MFARAYGHRYPLKQTSRIMKRVGVKLHIYNFCSDQKRRLFQSKDLVKGSRVFMNVQGYRARMYLTYHNKSMEIDYLTGVHNVVNKYHNSPDRTSYQYYNTVSMGDIPSVSESEIRKTLKYYGVQVVDGFTCLITECPICPLHVKDQIGRMYINKVTGKVFIPVTVSQFNPPSEIFPFA